MNNAGTSGNDVRDNGYGDGDNAPVILHIV